VIVAVLPIAVAPVQSILRARSGLPNVIVAAVSMMSGFAVIEFAIFSVFQFQDYRRENRTNHAFSPTDYTCRTVVMQHERMCRNEQNEQDTQHQ
jgi:hypothetical protein